jgi:hypothetical protein
MRGGIRITFFIWCVCCGLAFFPSLIWVEDRAMVLARYGWAGYRAGIRVAADRPPRFTNGDPVPQHLSVLTGFGVGLGMVVVMLAPAFVLPLRKDEAGQRKRGLGEMRTWVAGGRADDG